jgi:hypothetical protein
LVGTIEGQRGALEEIGAAEGTTLDETDGYKDGDTDDRTVGWSVHVPHVEVLEDTRVPVLLEYEPFIPTIVTREPVTAFTPPPTVHAPTDADNASHDPLDPLADVSNGRDGDGLPTPTYKELFANKQPAEQNVQAVGQSVCKA